MTGQHQTPAALSQTEKKTSYPFNNRLRGPTADVKVMENGISIFAEVEPRGVETASPAVIPTTPSLLVDIGSQA
jgi:hypothetical protein